MDVYHKVLYRLYEVTNGVNSKSVNFIDLVKGLGFHGNYKDIFDRLSGEGWIVETAKPDFVCISHWGVKEARDSVTTRAVVPDSEAKKESVKTAAVANEFAAVLESFSRNADKKNFAAVEKKFKELGEAVARIKKQL